MSKKIISFLGSGNYSHVKYGFQDKEGRDSIVETRFVQEAIHKLVGGDATVYVGLTDQSRESNWKSGTRAVRNYETGESEEIHMIGLKETLENKNIPQFVHKSISLSPYQTYFYL